MGVVDGLFSAEIEGTQDTAPIVRLTGELDMATAPDLDACLLTLADDDIVVDVSGLTFMDSSGLNTLIVALKRSRELGHKFVLRAPPAPVARLLQITGTDQVFTIEPA